MFTWSCGWCFSLLGNIELSLPAGLHTINKFIDKHLGQVIVQKSKTMSSVFKDLAFFLLVKLFDYFTCIITFHSEPITMQLLALLVWQKYLAYHTSWLQTCIVIWQSQPYPAKYCMLNKKMNYPTSQFNVIEILPWMALKLTPASNNNSVNSKSLPHGLSATWELVPVTQMFYIGANYCTTLMQWAIEQFLIFCLLCMA